MPSVEGACKKVPRSITYIFTLGQNAYYLECKRRIPLGKRIGCYRADSASYQAELLDQLEEDGVTVAMPVRYDAAPLSR
jgi:hypothetical protein